MIMNYTDSNLEFTELWVDKFGWENTIFLPSDFENVIKFPIKKEGYSLYYAYNFNGDNMEMRIFRGNEHEQIKLK